MCGICGSYQSPDTDVDAMVKALHHRGPDGAGVVTDGPVVHGNTRLAIIDPDSRSDQPFRYRDATLSYNGELWNYRGLRTALEARGHHFETASDTEVVAAAVTEWGRDAMAYLDGMFCFSYSSPRLRLIVRDRLGKLPLYALRTPTGFAWASERKAFGAAAGTAHAIPAGHYLDLDTGMLACYYDLSQRWRRMQIGNIAHNIDGWLENAVHKRLMADVPLCVLLSGGLDSSLTAALVARRRPDVIGYCVYVWPDSPDLHAARLVAQHIGIELREVQAPPPDDDAILRSIRTIEISMKTLIEQTTLTLHLAQRIHADGFKVCISGDAADELFGGYPRLAMAASLGDAGWREARLRYMDRMARGEFHAVNKPFMAYSVEPRMPFCDLSIVETVLSLSVADCPPHKKLLRRVAEAYLPAEIVKRPKAAFQQAAGVHDYCAKQYANPRRYYNSLVQSIYGRLVDG